MSTDDYLPRRGGQQGAPQGGVQPGLPPAAPAWAGPFSQPSAPPPPEEDDTGQTERVMTPSQHPMAPAHAASAFTPPPVQPPLPAPPPPVTVYAFPPQGQFPGEAYTEAEATETVEPEQAEVAEAGPVVSLESSRRNRVNFLRICKSEWIKLFTLNSTWWVLFVTIAVALGLGVLLMGSMRALVVDVLGGDLMSPQELRATDAASQSAQLLQLILGVLAVLFITNEYSSGQIRSSLMAVPKRWPVLAGKAVILSVVTFIVSGVSYYGAVLAGWPMVARYSNTELPDGWSLVDDRFTPDTLKMIALMSLATVLTLIFALAVGALLRNTAAGISTVVVVLFLLPVFMNILSWDWAATAHSYLLSSCQVGIYTEGPLDFVTSLWVTGVWAFAPLLVAGVLLQGRDA